MATDPCPRCLRPAAECTAEEWGDSKAILECRETELAGVRATLEATRAQLDRSQLLLVKSRDAIDLAISELQQKEAGRG